MAQNKNTNQNNNNIPTNVIPAAIKASALALIRKRAENDKARERYVGAIDKNGKIVTVYLRELLKVAPTYISENEIDFRLIDTPHGSLVWDIDGAKVIFRNGRFISDVIFLEFMLQRRDESVRNAASRKNKTDKPAEMEAVW